MDNISHTESNSDPKGRGDPSLKNEGSQGKKNEKRLKKYLRGLVILVLYLS